MAIYIYISDAVNNRVRKVDVASGIISTYAGNGIGGFSGDGGSATNAELNDPLGICFDQFGNLYIADEVNVRVRKVDPYGIISSVVGTGNPVYHGDGGRADTTSIVGAIGLCTDLIGNLYVADGTARVFKIDSNGIITTFAGNGLSYYSGEGLPATNAGLIPMVITIDKNDNLYIGNDAGDYRIQVVNSAGIISTAVGDGISGYLGDGGPADSAEINWGDGLVTDSCGNLYMCDLNNYRIRKITFDSTCTGTNKASQPLQSQIAIYPNPASNVLDIDGIESNSKFELFNIIGIIEQSGVLQKGSNELPISTLPTGMYLLQLTDEQGRKTMKKVVKE